MKKPKEAIERMRKFVRDGGCEIALSDGQDYRRAILAYLDSIPDDAHVCEWPKELTRERLEHLASNIANWHPPTNDALRALAAIAPQRKKRMVNLWHREGWSPDHLEALDVCANPNQPDKWRKVGGPVEIDG